MLRRGIVRSGNRAWQLLEREKSSKFNLFRFCRPWKMRRTSWWQQKPKLWQWLRRPSGLLPSQIPRMTSGRRTGWRGCSGRQRPPENEQPHFELSSRALCRSRCPPPPPPLSPLSFFIRSLQHLKMSRSHSYIWRCSALEFSSLKTMCLGGPRYYQRCHLRLSPF